MLTVFLDVAPPPLLWLSSESEGSESVPALAVLPYYSESVPVDGAISCISNQVTSVGGTTPAGIDFRLT